IPWSASSMDEYVSKLLRRLAALANVPAPVRKQLDANAPEVEVMRALIDAGRAEHDATEPSWPLLGRLIQEARFIEVCRNLSFLHSSLAVSAEEQWGKVKHLVADHPLHAYAGTFGLDLMHQNPEFLRLFQSIPHAELDYRALSVIQTMFEAAPQ